MLIILIMHSLSLILINVLETCTTVSKSSHNLLWILNMIFQLFLHKTGYHNAFVATKDKFKILHLPDIINDVQFPSLFCVIFSIGIKETFKPAALFDYCYTIRWLNQILKMFSLLLVCSCFPEKVFILE